LENKVWWSPKRLEYVLGSHFRGLELEKKSLLEIGAGHGLFSIWCAVNGARRVTALEPEASGSTKGIRSEFKKVMDGIELKKEVQYSGMTVEKYLASEQRQTFDYILMHAVINHLDEDATRRLHLVGAEKERESYRSIFRGLFNLLTTNGVVLIYDVAKHNLWSDFKLKNPFAGTIEYEKHQQPRIWAKLLSDCGFEFLDLLWFTPFRLRKMRLFLSWWLPAYFINSSFILRRYNQLRQNSYSGNSQFSVSSVRDPSHRPGQLRYSSAVDSRLFNG